MEGGNDQQQAGGERPQRVAQLRSPAARGATIGLAERLQRVGADRDQLGDFGGLARPSPGSRDAGERLAIGRMSLEPQFQLELLLQGDRPIMEPHQPCRRLLAGRFRIAAAHRHSSIAPASAPRARWT